MRLFTSCFDYMAHVLRHALTGHALTLLLLAGLLPLAARAQAPVVTVTPAGPLTLCAGSTQTLTATANVPGFNVAGSGFNGLVQALAVQADGKVLVGGDFTAYNGNANAPDYVLRLNPDGLLDNSFNNGGAGANGIVQALAVQADGKVLVGGGFTDYNGNAAAPDRVLRLNPDGSLNNAATAPAGLTYTWSNGATGPSITVSQPGDYQATATTTANGTGYSNVVRVNAPAAVTVSLSPAGPLALPAGGSATLTATATMPGFNVAGSGVNGNVSVMAVQADGKVLVGGQFTAYNGNAAAPDGLLRLNADGTLDASFNLGGAGVGIGSVSAIAVQPDGKVLIGGNFFSYNAAASPRLFLRLNANGTLDTSFNPGGTGPNNAIVDEVLLLPDGRVLISGQFTSYNGIAAAPDGVLRVNANGTLDTSFNPSGAGVSNGTAIALALQPDGKVLVGGNFTTYNGNAAAPDFVLRLNADGTLDTSFNLGGSGPNPASVGISGGSVTQLAVQPDGKVLVGGQFTSYNGNAAAPDNLLRLNADGRLNDADVPLAGATFVFTPGNTAGSARTVSTAGTYTATATAPATGCTYTSNAVVVTVAPADLTISNAQTVPAGTYHDILVTGPTTGGAGVGTLGGAVTVTGTVTVQAGGALLTNCQPLTGGAGTSFVLAAGGTLGICDPAGIAATGATGAVQTATRSFAADAIYLYNGTVAQVTGTGLPGTVRELALSNAAGVTLSQPVQLTQRVLLSSGNLTLAGQALTLLSDANGTALVANLGGLVLGNTATLQRHIETNTAASGYRHYASPMQAGAGAETLATLATAGYTPDFSGAAAYNSSATPSLVTPFPSVYLYNQDRIAGLTSDYGTFDKGW
ncbi:beta strand repeat-containing protein [Hymenobacter monticola]|uniref:beta strand repeat-containing protein n=1 Tax=Hymenobacter monticola TaxID=1705399 RepID=UPI0021D421DC|nr:delta-60 repeat domain-containing protein [Hymenobacter monticola]